MKKAGLAVSLVGPSSLSIFQQLQEIYPYFSIQPLELNRQFSFDQLRIPIKPKVQKRRSHLSRCHETLYFCRQKQKRSALEILLAQYAPSMCDK